MDINFRNILMMVLIGLISTINVIAQDAEIKKTRFQLNYFKDHKKVETIVATLKIKEKSYVPFSNAEIDIYNLTDTSKVFLEKIITDENGNATIFIQDDKRIYKDSAGIMKFEVEYKGDSSTKAADRSIEIKPMNLSLSFFQEDSIKYISVKANEITPGEKTPIIGVDIGIFIQGTFSLLNIGEEESNTDGELVIEFPVHMPGDTAGVLTIVSKIVDHDLYGNVETIGKINWGKRVPLEMETHRGLGDTDAPLWMVYTLIILLSAVWFHYFYVIYLIVKIKFAK